MAGSARLEREGAPVADGDDEQAEDEDADRVAERRAVLPTSMTGRASASEFDHHVVLCARFEPLWGYDGGVPHGAQQQQPKQHEQHAEDLLGGAADDRVEARGEGDAEGSADGDGEEDAAGLEDVEVVGRGGDDWREDGLVRLQRDVPVGWDEMLRDVTR
jgi:hypothetical protein